MGSRNLAQGLRQLALLLHRQLPPPARRRHAPHRNVAVGVSPLLRCSLHARAILPVKLQERDAAAPDAPGQGRAEAREAAAVIIGRHLLGQHNRIVAPVNKRGADSPG
jgi:hypothetical protein